MTTATGIAIGISTLALVVSVVTLWRTQFAPAHLVTMCGVPRLQVYSMESAGERWVNPAIYLTVAFSNEGARATVVEAVRLMLSYPDVSSAYNHHAFRPLTVTKDPLALIPGGEEARDERFKTGTVWMSVLVPARDTAIRHLVLQTGAWDAPPLGRAIGTFEIKERDKTWRHEQRWTFDLSPEWWPRIYEGMAMHGRVDHPADTVSRVAPKNLTELIAAKAEEEFGPRPYEEIHALSEQRKREAAEESPDSQ